MLELTDMKKSPVEVKKDDCCKTCEPCERDMYPYGLEGSLDEDSIAKLGIDITDVKAGEEIIIKGIARITDVGSEERMRDNKPIVERHIRWQIQKLGIKFQNNFEDSFDEASKKKND